MARYPIPSGAPSAAEGQSTSRELSAPMPDFAGQEGLSRRTCASCRARARATRGSGPRPPQTGDSGYGAARGSLGFDSRGRPPPAPLDGAVQLGTSLWPHVQGHGARVRGQRERARDAGRVPVRRAPKCPLRLWAHTRRGNHQSVPGRKAEVKEGRVPGPSYGLTWAARYAGGGRRCPCVDRYLSPKKKNINAYTY